MKILKWIFKKFGYKIISINDYDNEIKVHIALSDVLKRKLITLAFNPDSLEALQIKACLEMERDFEEMIWFGVPIVINEKGIIPIINNPNTV